MATALFIKREDLVRNSILDGNVDTSKFIQFIKIAQQIIEGAIICHSIEYNFAGFSFYFCIL